MRWTAVVNPEAGRGRTRSLLPRLRAALEAREIDVHVSSDVEDGARAAADAAGRGRGVLACGGDGTVSALAAVVSRERAPLAIVPTGAGNDLARHLGLDTKHPLDAVALVDTGRLATIDLGRATAADGTSTMFTTVANVGFDAEANRWANDVRWVTGTTLYVLATLRTLATYRPAPVRVQVDGTVWEGSAWLVAVGNTRWYAGGMMITPDASIDDGSLDVCVVEGVPVRRLLVSFPRVFRGTHVGIDGVRVFRGPRVELSSGDGATRDLELWASGERVGPAPACVEVAPGALQVLVPEGSPATGPRR